MKKFTKIIKAVFEKDIEETMDAESNMKQKAAHSRLAVASNLHEDHDDEEEETILLKKMKDDK